MIVCKPVKHRRTPDESHFLNDIGHNYFSPESLNSIIACAVFDVYQMETITEVENLDLKGCRLDQLCRYIVFKHHRFTYRQIPIISALANKIAADRENRYPEINKIAEIFDRMATDTRLHMQKEERILFPFIEQLVEAAEENVKVNRPFFGTVNNPTQIMKIEHEQAADDMAAIRALTANYRLPKTADPLLVNLFERLINLEADLNIHVHLENDILFPKAIQLEKEIGLS